MNEFKNSTPLMAGIANENDKIIQNLVNRTSNYICLNKDEKMEFSKNLFPIIKEHSRNHIENLYKLAGMKIITDITDIMIAQEKNIQKKICDEIADIPDKLELYYYSYFLVYSYYEKLDFIDENILTNYSTKSLDNLITSINGDTKKDEIFNKRNKRFEDYEVMWNQIEYDEYDKSSKMTMFFYFAEKNVYGKHLFMKLKIMHLYFLEMLSNGVESYLDLIAKSIGKSNPSLFDKVKSFFK